MKKCKVKIRTETDGKVSVFESEGEAAFEAETVTIRYVDQEGTVTISISERVRIRREGDYRLSLDLAQGKGSALLGFGAENGEIPVSVEVCAVKKTQDTVRFRANYSLDFSKEKQNMRLYFVAVIKQETV